MKTIIARIPVLNVYYVWFYTTFYSFESNNPVVTLMS